VFFELRLGGQTGTLFRCLPVIDLFAGWVGIAKEFLGVIDFIFGRTFGKSKVNR
jgi:hypothetical protein